MYDFRDILQMEMMEILVFLFVYKGNEEALLAILVKRIANETSTSLSLAKS